MNSLNILSSRVSPSASPQPSRSNSLAHIGFAASEKPLDHSKDPGRSADSNYARGAHDESAAAAEKQEVSAEPEEYAQHDEDSDRDMDVDEKSPLLHSADDLSGKDAFVRSSPWHAVPRRLASGFINSFRWVLSTIAAPGVYFIACFYDRHGTFAPLRHLWGFLGFSNPDALKPAAHFDSNPDHAEDTAVPSHPGARGNHAFTAMRPAPSYTSSSGLSSESESDIAQQRIPGSRRGSASATSRHARSKSQPAEETVPARRSIRIKLNNDDAMRQRKHKKAQSVSAAKSGAGGSLASPDLSAQLKSPTSPYNALTKYPKSPAPPRPLIPRRQPSYVPFEPDTKHLKTLILDLDETLIHSMSKGGRMGSGHMVEVRLNTTYVGSSGQQALGPQHPILYYVHKRPYCDEFLRKICKWFNLVIFTASVQEYADPVIDWLESERKFFTARYYRQHCTFRHGAYIKDLSSVEPDLSKVMILDNSPLSYMFHQDNAIPIQGWISDPTDNDLLHLVPLLEGLQYVSDVRALLTLRGGEDGQHV